MTISNDPPPLMDENIRDALLQMAQAITTQEPAVTAEVQAMTAQSNRDIVPRPNQQISTMASHLRDFTWMNPPTFYGSKVVEDPKELFDEVNRIILSMGYPQVRRLSLPLIDSKMWLMYGTSTGEIICH